MLPRNIPQKQVSLFIYLIVTSIIHWDINKEKNNFLRKK